MFKKIIIIFLFFLLIPCCFAGNNTTAVDYPTMHLEDDATITTALEGGDSNISFSDGYQGYCIEWGEHSAEAGDTFYVHDTVDNRLKTFFVYFYDESQRDVIATQHMIWKFTDNKQFSRFNQTLYEQIIAKSATVQVPNEGSIPYGNQTMFFSFKTFVSEIEEYQDYFGYRIFFTVMGNDTSICLNESICNNSTILLSELYNNTSNIIFNHSSVVVNNHTYHSHISDTEKIMIMHETGVNILWLIVCVLFMLGIIIIIRK